MNIESIRSQAEEEIRQEDFRIAVEKMKEKLRKRRPIWDRIFPYKIVFISKKKDLEKC